MTRKKKAASPKVKDGKQTLKAADTAGADYAHEQISGSYFADWVHDQLANPPANPLPLATKADARVIARNMLQQLEWDTKRELEPHTILGLSGAAGGGGARSKEVVATFYKGFDRVLKDAKVVDWLADEILNASRHGQVAESASRHEIKRVSPDRGRAGAYTYRGAKIWISGPSGGTWWATVKFKNQEKDLDARSFDEVLEKAKEWIDAAPEWPRANESNVARDYIAVDRNDRRIAGPFRSRHEAERHVPPGGYVKFSSATRRRPPPPPSSYPMFRARAPKKTDRRGQKRR